MGFFAWDKEVATEVVSGWFHKLKVTTVVVDGIGMGIFEGVFIGDVRQVVGMGSCRLVGRTKGCYSLSIKGQGGVVLQMLLG